MSNRFAISSQGVAQESGLGVFNTITTYTGEHINWGNALAYGSQLGSDIETIVSGDEGDVQYYALVHGNPSTKWLRYRTTTGTNHYAGTAPTSGSGFFTLYGASSGAKLSYAGMYQKLPTITGAEYTIEVTNTIDTDTGILNVNTYFPRYNVASGVTGYKVNSTATTNYPVSSASQCILSSDFTAKSPNDVIMIYFTTTSASASINITNISIKQKVETLIPVYTSDIYGNAQNVLRRNIDNPIFNT